MRSRADAPHLKKAALAIEQAAWSHLGYLSYTRSHYEYYTELLDAYPEFQLCLVDEESDYPVAVASSAPFVCSGPEDLPAEGWDWVVETAARNKHMKPNMLGGLAVSTFMLRISSNQYLSSAFDGLENIDLFGGLLKPLVFGAIIALVGCHCGLRTYGGTQGVGRSTTQAVVNASVLILFFDFLLSRLILQYT